MRLGLLLIHPGIQPPKADHPQPTFTSASSSTSLIGGELIEWPASAPSWTSIAISVIGDSDGLLCVIDIDQPTQLIAVTMLNTGR